MLYKTLEDTGKVLVNSKNTGAVPTVHVSLMYNTEKVPVAQLILLYSHNHRW